VVFWSQLSEEKKDLLYEKIQSLLEAGASHEEIREMKASILEEWGFDASLWNGPHFDEQIGGNGKMARDGQRSGNQFGVCRNGGQGSGLKGQGNKGVCSRSE
jgi:hypothetical protein